MIISKIFFLEVLIMGLEDLESDLIVMIVDSRFPASD